MADDELAGSTTEGYKVGQKKTLDEYNNLDAEDEALAKWKKSLGLGEGTPVGDPNDPRTVIIEQLSLLVKDRPDISVDLTSEEALNSLSKKPFIIKEGASFQMQIKFRVQHEVISGLRYVQLVKRMGVRLDKSEEMLGSYGPNTDKIPQYNKTLLQEEAPSGMTARATYAATSRFTDDDKKVHLEFNWAFTIKKNWE
ncbi:hypothetical protein ABW20_dc0103479 [Dactylellina cionopaga]|nr:hypothetical protein ABW20_dc0103479 [Dactylellina cionopaga]